MRTLIFLLLLFPIVLRSATIPADSAERADVATAVGLASSGDTVTIPSGTATWTSALSIPSGIKIVGAGIGNTIITGAGVGLFVLNDFTWVEGISMISSGGNTSTPFCSITGTNIVIKLCRFDSSVNWNGSAWLAVRDTQHEKIPNGVISQCALVDSRVLIESPYFNGMHQRWAEPTRLGYQDTWYIEKCAFTNINWGQNVIDANYSGSYVVRYTHFHNCTPSMHSIQSFNSRGPRKFEKYKCSFSGPNAPNLGSITTTGVFYDMTNINVTLSKAKVAISLARAYQDVGTGGRADGHSNWDGNTALYSGTHNGTGDASILTDTTKNWTVNEFVVSGWSRWIYNTTDGSKAQCTANTATTFTGTLSGGTDNNWDTGDSYFITDGWPARDQPGAGKDATAWVGYYTSAAPTQASEPIYIWGLVGFNASPVSLNSQGQPQTAQLVQEGRDYIFGVHPSYTPLVYPHPLLGEEGEPPIDPMQRSFRGQNNSILVLP